MSEIQSHRDLVVWQKSMDLAELVYRLTATFPRTEEYRLTAQVVRAAASVPANIAEGHARGTRRDYAHYLSIAKGSLAETETFLMLAVRLNFAPQTAAQESLDLVVEVSKMLTALRSRLLNG